MFFETVLGILARFFDEFGTNTGKTYPKQLASFSPICYTIKPVGWHCYETVPQRRSLPPSHRSKGIIDWRLESKMTKITDATFTDAAGKGV